MVGTRAIVSVESLRVNSMPVGCPIAEIIDLEAYLCSLKDASLLQQCSREIVGYANISELQESGARSVDIGILPMFVALPAVAVKAHHRDFGVSVLWSPTVYNVLMHVAVKKLMCRIIESWHIKAQAMSGVADSLRIY